MDMLFNYFLFKTVIILTFIYRAQSNKTCKLIEPRIFCQSALECSENDGILGHVDCQNRACCCANHSEYNMIQGCYWKKYIGDKCEFDADCVIKNSVCKNLICQCLTEKMIFKNGKCEETEKRYLGDSCMSTSQCNVVTNAICSDNHRCKCPDKKILQNEICIDPDPDPIIVQYNECRKNNGVLLPNGTCDQYPSAMMLEYEACLKYNEHLFNYFIAAPNDGKASTIPCRSDSDCKRYSEHSLCINNTVDTPGHCECFKDYIPQQNKTYFQCLARPDSFGGACVKDIQCQYEFSNWAVCRSGHCACIEGAHFWDKQCYQSIGLGQTCSFNQQCRLKNGSIASCLAGRCSCGFLEHPVSKSDGDSCEKNRELGEQCNKNEECVTEHTRCVGVCDCKPGYTTNGDGRGCLREAEALGDYCIEDAQCEIISNYTYCEQFTCRCRNHHHVYLGKCYRSVRLNGTCHDNRNCWYIPDFKDKIHCKEGRCSCVHQYTADGKFCESAGFKFKESVFVIFLANILFWKMLFL